MKQLQSPRELAPIDAIFKGGPVKVPPNVAFETARVGKGFGFGPTNDKKELRNTFHTMGHTPRDGHTRVNFDIGSVKNS